MLKISQSTAELIIFTYFLLQRIKVPGNGVEFTTGLLILVNQASPNQKLVLRTPEPACFQRCLFSPHS